MSIELSEVQREKILKGMDEVIAVSVLLENDLGTQQDFLSANAVCMIKEKSNEVRDMLILMGECRNSRASMTGGDRAGRRFIFHHGKKKKSVKRKRGVS